MVNVAIKVVGAAILACVVELAIAAPPVRAESVVRVGMTAGDIPDWTGQPDQGFEGFRFVGWTLHDSFINWDLSRSDREAPLTPGLATRWTIDPGNDKRWIFALRKGVKFHDGCDWNADNAIWNLERLTNDKSPQFHPVHFARQRARTNSIEKFEKIDDYTIAIYTKTTESLFPYNMDGDLEVRTGGGRQRLQGLRQITCWNRPLQVRQSGLPRAARAGQEPRLLEQGATFPSTTGSCSYQCRKPPPGQRP